MTKTLDDRRVALEEEFFHKENEKNLARLRAEMERKESKDALKQASGMSDDAVVDRLVALGLSATTVTALTLVPLIAVAWADGELQDSEREAILKAASDKGMGPGTPSHDLLVGWLAERPGDGLFDAWDDYLKALKAQLDDAQLQALKEQIVGSAKAIAESAGGFLGFKKVSSQEQEVLSRIERSFAR